MSDTEMQRLIDEAQAALDDHFRPRLVVDNKAQLNMTDIVERLRQGVDPHDVPEAENAMDKAAAEIERLRAVLRDILAWNGRNGGYGELPPLIQAAEAALQEGI